jgi:tellurite resistance protein TehA-like permease
MGLRTPHGTLVGDLDPSAFAVVMATGICATDAADLGQVVLSRMLLGIAAAALTVLLVMLAWRIGRYPGRVRADLGAPQRAFGFFTLVAACVVVSIGLAGAGHRPAAIALAGFGAAVWVVLTYVIPAGLILARTDRVLVHVNGTWFLWVVGTQSVAVAAATLAPAGVSVPALVAAVAWSVGVVLYLLVAILVAARLLLVPVRAVDLGPAYWVAMGATAITVLAAAQLLAVPTAPVVSAMHGVLTGLGTVLWGLGTWLIPLLAGFSLWRLVRRSDRAPSHQTWWSAVFPLGMYAAASSRFATVVRLPLIARTGHAGAWVALAVWLLVAATTGTRVVIAATRQPYA